MRQLARLDVALLLPERSDDAASGKYGFLDNIFEL